MQFVFVWGLVGYVYVVWEKEGEDRGGKRRFGCEDGCGGRWLCEDGGKDRTGFVIEMAWEEG